MALSFSSSFLFPSLINRIPAASMSTGRTWVHRAPQRMLPDRIGSQNGCPFLLNSRSLSRVAGGFRHFAVAVEEALRRESYYCE